MNDTKHKPTKVLLKAQEIVLITYQIWQIGFKKVHSCLICSNFYDRNNNRSHGKEKENARLQTV